MNRRDLLLASGALLASPLTSRAQRRLPRVAVLTYAAGPFTEQYVRGFRAGMKDVGYEDGRNVALEVQHGHFSRETTDRLAAELVASNPAVIVSQSYATRAVLARTQTVPVVCTHSADMVLQGMIQSLARPGGNLTGIQLLTLDLAGKRIELLKQLVPEMRRLAVIADPGHAGEHLERDVSVKAAERLGVQTSYHPVRSQKELDEAPDQARAAGAEGITIFPDSVTNPNAARTAAILQRLRLPSVAGWANFAETGHLVSYGPDLQATWRKLAVYVDRILKGANPAQMPVELPSTFELALNLKTARALDISVPQAVLLRADRVIE